MLMKVLRFVRLPYVLLFLYALGRFWIGIRGVPYAPRGNAIFSVVGLTLVSSLYFGALSKRVGGFGWLGTVLVGLFIGLWAQILVVTFTLVSFLGHFDASYYLNPDSLPVPAGGTLDMSVIAMQRGGGLVVNCILAIVAASIGRLLAALAPQPGAADA